MPVESSSIRQLRKVALGEFPISFLLNPKIKSSSWVAIAKQVADQGMAHCHLAIYSKVLNQSTKAIFHNDKLIQKPWAPNVHQLLHSLDSPVLIFDTVSETSDVRALEPKTR